MEFCILDKFLTLDTINLKKEIEKNYTTYPIGVVIAFIRCGAISVYDMKNLIIQHEKGELIIRNIGTKRIEIAKELIDRYKKGLINEKFCESDISMN